MALPFVLRLVNSDRNAAITLDEKVLSNIKANTAEVVLVCNITEGVRYRVGCLFVFLCAREGFRVGASQIVQSKQSFYLRANPVDLDRGLVTLGELPNFFRSPLFMIVIVPAFLGQCAGIYSIHHKLIDLIPDYCYIKRHSVYSGTSGIFCLLLICSIMLFSTLARCRRQDRNHPI
jgi:hypothetical protein